jgi:hypothetical protein
MRGGLSMLFRRLLAVFLVLGVLAGLTIPAVGQEKDKDKGKDKGKEKAEKEKEKPKDTGDKVSMKWKFTKGKTFYQKMVTKTIQNMKVMNNDVNQTQNQTFIFSWTPTAVDDAKGTATIEQKITGVIMDIEIGGSKIQYDSTKEAVANNPLGDFFKALVGSTFTITLDLKNNSVLDMKGREEFLKKLVAANPQMKPLLDTILSQDALKEMAEPVFNVVPTTDVTKGYKWTKTTKLDMGPIGKYENKYAYEYTGPEGEGDKKVQVIKVDTKLTYTAPGEVAGQGGLPFKIKSASLTSSNPVGLIKFNPAKGRVDSSMTKLELKGSLSIEIGGQATKVDLSQTQESTVESSDEDPIAKKK